MIVPTVGEADKLSAHSAHPGDRCSSIPDHGFPESHGMPTEAAARQQCWAFLGACASVRPVRKVGRRLLRCPSLKQSRTGLPRNRHSLTGSCSNPAPPFASQTPSQRSSHISPQHQSRITRQDSDLVRITIIKLSRPRVKSKRQPLLFRVSCVQDADTAA